MVQFLQDQKGIGAPPITADERIELEQLRSSNETLKEKIAAKQNPKKKDESEDSYDEEHESSDSEVSQLVTIKHFESFHNCELINLYLG